MKKENSGKLIQLRYLALFPLKCSEKILPFKNKLKRGYFWNSDSS